MDYRDKREVKNALDNIKRKINKSGKVTFTAENDVKILKSENYVRFDVPFDIPQNALFFIGKSLIPKDKVKVENKSILIQRDFLWEIRNTSHKLVVVNGVGIDVENLSKEGKEKLLAKKQVATIPFTKKGLTYHVMTWDEDYKGIDDYLLYLKTKKTTY